MNKLKSSLNVPSYTKSGRKSKQVALPKEVFGQEPNKTLIAQAVRVFLSNQRKSRAKTKSRGDVRASKAKIWRQKGTGRARHGARSAPIFVGGGVAHGPKGIENYEMNLPAKMRKKALVSALSTKFREGKVVVADLEGVEPKTRNVALFLQKVGNSGKTTIVHSSSIPLWRAGRNIANLNLVLARQLTAYDVVSAQKLIFTKEGISVLTERIKTKEKRENEV